MGEITPAQPRAEGATIMWRTDVPDGWEWRAADDAPWHLSSTGANGDWLVEARPPKPRTVTAELSEEDARCWAAAGGVAGAGDFSRRLASACRDGLAALDGEK